MSEAPRECQVDQGKIVLRMRLCADPRTISPVVDAVLKITREMKCAEGKDFEIETALREALANAIQHGCGNDPSKVVECCVACDERRGLLLIVRDPGSGFDPVAVADPTREQNIYSAHGRGIFLINTLMDEVRFERGGREIHMRKE